MDTTQFEQYMTPLMMGAWTLIMLYVLYEVMKETNPPKTLKIVLYIAIGSGAAGWLIWLVLHLVRGG